MGIQVGREENSQGLEYELKVKMSNLIEGFTFLVIKNIFEIIIIFSFNSFWCKNYFMVVV